MGRSPREQDYKRGSREVPSLSHLVRTQREVPAMNQEEGPDHNMTVLASQS